MSYLLKVLTINIWNRQGPWERRVQLLRAGIDALAPDIIGMQEVLTDGRRSLADEIFDGSDYRGVFGAAKQMPGGIVFGNTAHSRFPVALEDVVPLPDVGTGSSRSLLVSEIDTPEGPLPFLVTHLNWKFHHGFAREAQVQVLADAIGKRFPVSGGGLPPIMVGDFNARPDATEIRFLTGLQSLDGASCYLCDCFDAVGEGPGYTFDARHNPHAAYTHEPPRRIDYIFVRGPDAQARGVVQSCNVVLDQVSDGVAPSDHFGVYAEILI